MTKQDNKVKAKFSVEAWEDNDTRLDSYIYPEQLGLDEQQEFDKYDELWLFAKNFRARGYDVWDYILYPPERDDIYNVVFYARPS